VPLERRWRFRRRGECLSEDLPQQLRPIGPASRIIAEPHHPLRASIHCAASRIALRPRPEMISAPPSRIPLRPRDGCSGLQACPTRCNINYMSTPKEGRGRFACARSFAGGFAAASPQTGSSARQEIRIDREEITVTGVLADPETAHGLGGRRARRPRGRPDRADSARRAGTSEWRSPVKAEHSFGRKISWGVTCGGATVMFTTYSCR